MHPSMSITLSAAILRVKDALEGHPSVHLNDALPSPWQIVRLPARINVSHQNCADTIAYNTYISPIRLENEKMNKAKWMLSSYCFPAIFTLSIHFKEHFSYCVISHIII